MQKQYEDLYYIDSNNRLRVWRLEQLDNTYRTVSGLVDGKKVTSTWKSTYAKNVGKKNSTTDTEQATAEIKSLYTKQLDRKYSKDKDKAVRSNILEPMLAKKYDPKKTEKKEWLQQPKLDGVRTLIDGSGANSRAGKPFYTVQHISDELKTICEEYNCTIDGELYNHEYAEKFEELLSLIKQQKIEKLSEEDFEIIRNTVKLYAYDVIFHDEPDMPFYERYARLSDFISGNTPIESFPFDMEEVGQNALKNVILVPAFPINLSYEDIEIPHLRHIENGYEGIMLRDPNSPYEFKRSAYLLKHKNFIDDEFEIISLNEGKGNYSGMVKGATLRLEDGQECDSGIKGNQTYLKKLFEEREEYVGGQATTKFQGRTSANKLRFPVIKAVFKGKRDM